MSPVAGFRGRDLIRMARFVRIKDEELGRPITGHPGVLETPGFRVSQMSERAKWRVAASWSAYVLVCVLALTGCPGEDPAPSGPDDDDPWVEDMRSGSRDMKTAELGDMGPGGEEDMRVPPAEEDMPPQVIEDMIGEDMPGRSDMGGGPSCQDECAPDELVWLGAGQLPRLRPVRPGPLPGALAARELPVGVPVRGRRVACPAAAASVIWGDDLRGGVDRGGLRQLRPGRLPGDGRRGQLRVRGALRAGRLPCRARRRASTSAPRWGRRCVRGTRSASAASTTRTGAWIWGRRWPAGWGQACSQGACAPSCQDSCPGAGATECVGDGVRTCEDADGDGCLAWSAPQACPSDQSCSEGACSAECADDCDGAGVATCEPGGQQLQQRLDGLDPGH